MAAVGALLVSSGIALMAAPTPASAERGHNPVPICHATGSESHPYVYNTPDADTFFKTVGHKKTLPAGHLTHHGDIISKFTYQGHSYGPFNVPEGVSLVNGQVTREVCNGGGSEVQYASVTLTWLPADCGTDYATFEMSAEHVVWAVALVGGHKVDPGDHLAPDALVQVKAMAAHGYVFQTGDEETSKFFKDSHQFEGAQCELLSPVAPTYVEPTCTTAPSVKTPSSEVVKYDVTGSQVAGGKVQVTASLVNPKTTGWAEGAQTTWEHTFTVPTGCSTVSPPAVAPTTAVSPPKTHVKHKTEVKAETTTPTVVEAGLAGTTTDTSLQTGLGLALAGLALMAGAAGLVLVGGGKDEDTA
jgi:hypothetical protein